MAEPLPGAVGAASSARRLRVDPGHLKLAEVALRAASRYGFALAGGYAVQAHGILDRPSEDVDLFTAWERRGEHSATPSASGESLRAGHLVREAPGDAAAGGAPRSTGARTVA